MEDSPEYGPKSKREILEDYVNELSQKLSAEITPVIKSYIYTICMLCIYGLVDVIKDSRANNDWIDTSLNIMAATIFFIMLFYYMRKLRDL